MGALVATLLCAYTIAKVTRDSLFLIEFGALALPYAYIGVALASVGFVWLESRVAGRFTRVSATRLHQYIAIVFSLAAAAVYPLARHWTAAAFYLWTGSQAMMLLPHFWVLALDVWDSRRARRLFPLLSGCGLIGGLVGGGVAGWLTPVVKRVGLIWILAALLIVAHLLTRRVEAHRARRAGAVHLPAGASRWEIVKRSTFIKFLAGALALSVVVSTLVDFQFKFFIQGVYRDPHDLTQFLGKFYAVLNGLTLIFQFGAAGWLLNRFGLGASTGLQPAVVMVLSGWAALSTGWWVVVGMRWTQGVVLQTLGKSSAEIYYMAVRPSDRRQIKPAIDTLAERWSDAVVGVLLLVILHTIGGAHAVIASLTAVIAAIWLVVLLRLNQQYGAVVQEAVSSRWIDPEAAAESIRDPSARRALVEAMRSDEERRVIAALKLCEQARHDEIARAVRDCLRHPSPAVRAAAVEVMEAMGLRDRDERIREFLHDPHEGLRRAAVGYLLAQSARPEEFIRELLEGEDPALRQYVIDALFERPHEASTALTPEWVDALLKSGTSDDLLLAARALGCMPSAVSAPRLRVLLSNPELEVQRTALLSATRRPSAELLDLLLPLLSKRELSYESRRAVAAIGDAAVPELRRMLEREGGAQAQDVAARTLARIASPRAVEAIMTLVQSPDPTRRHLGFRSASRVHLQTGQPVLARIAAHRHFLRELRDYETWLRPALQYERDAAREVRLLAESCREFAEMALERALRALACWYEPRPVSSAFGRLRSRDVNAAAAALEYLGHVLPRAIFRPLASAFDWKSSADPEHTAPNRTELAEWIRAAWRSGDAWLRACAVRAARYAPGVDPGLFTKEDRESPIVEAELRALATGAAAGAAFPSGAAIPPRRNPC